MYSLFFFFNDTATTEIYTLSLHDALPIACGSKVVGSPPFPFPPPGASGGHRRLRCATARARRRPKAERFPRSGPVRKRAWVGRGSRPGPRVLNFMNQTG